MLPKYFIGVDISKLTLDFAILDPTGHIESCKIANSEEAILKILATFKAERHFRNREVAIIAEDMRVFAKHLLNVAQKKNYPIYLESALRIKKSLGIQRGKNDKLDAIRIAQYAKKNFNDLKLWQPPRECIQKLMLLSSTRKRLVKVKKILVSGEKSHSDFMTRPEKFEMNSYYSASMAALEKDIDGLELEMQSVVQMDQNLSMLMELLTSIPFIGKIVAVQLIICTNEFKNFTSAKKFASFCGVAPFEYTSGSSLKGRNRISHYANKDIKSVLHFATIGYLSKPQYFLSKYYKRKVEEGKNKMSIINAMRNKLICRIFSCINSGKKFTDI